MLPFASLQHLINGSALAFLCLCIISTPLYFFSTLIYVNMVIAFFSPLITSVTFLFLQPKATIRFPMGEVTLDEREEEEVPRKFSINGILKGPILNGVCAAHYTDEELKLRYSYKVVFSSVLLLSSCVYVLI